MIWIDIDGQRLGLTFAHPTVNGKKKQPQRKTICEIYAGKNGSLQLLASNETACSKQDNFQKSIGRKIALARTICQHDYGYGTVYNSLTCLKCGSKRVNTLPLTKDARTKIWLSYFDAISPKPVQESNEEEN